VFELHFLNKTWASFNKGMFLKEVSLWFVKYMGDAI
jgi:hypothetical protein